MADTFRPPMQITFDTEGNIYGFHGRQPGQKEIRKMDPSGREILSFTARESPYPTAASRVSSSGLVYHEGVVYFSKVTGPEIYKYTADGQLVDVFKRTPAVIAQ